MHAAQPAAQANVGTQRSPELQSDSTLQNSPSPPPEPETVGLLLPPQFETHTVGPTPGIGARLWVRSNLSSALTFITHTLAKKENNTNNDKKLLKIQMFVFAFFIE